MRSVFRVGIWRTRDGWNEIASLPAGDCANARFPLDLIGQARKSLELF
jgi:hypothetical protein